jgi:thioester reductase-like protein
MTAADYHTTGAPGASDADERRELLRRALLEVKLARAGAAAAGAGRGEPVAVVGVGCRFPGGAVGVEGFWGLLEGGRLGVGEVPGDRWDAGEFFDADPDAPGRTYARHGGFIEGIREFDAGLFGIPPREAVSMDPQHRLVLEVAWEALEHAGVAPDSVRGSRTGVFVGMRNSDYERLGAGDVSLIDAYAALGTALNFGANRLSYALGLEGPSLVVDTACSSSLVAVHLACQSLRSGECDMALAGGVNALLSPDAMVALSKGRMLSPSGLCRTFDAAADGYVRGEGCGIVVLRRLSSAVAAGDEVLAVIRGSAVNQDGRSNGLTAPNGFSQEKVIRRALSVADVAPAEVGYVEAHGTGTVLGDPIEVRALARVLGEGRPAGQPVALGSVKTNIGHLEAAAGIAGLIKAVLAVQRGMIPPHLHLSQPNPHVAWDDLPVTVPTRLTPWTQDRRIAGVSSFGFGGTNAHVIVAAHAPADLAPAGGPQAGSAPAAGAAGLPVVVKVSGAGAGSVREGAARLASFVAEAGDIDLAGLAWAAGTGRAELADRAAVVAGSAPELVAGLRAVAGGVWASGVVSGRRPAGAAPKVALVTPGHGARVAGVLEGVYGVVPVVTEVVDRCVAAGGPAAAAARDALAAAGRGSEAALAGTEVAQPALYALGVALGAWWRSAGVEPDLLAGHSVGGYAAAALAGVFSVEDGARLIGVRGALMGALPAGGAMARLSCQPGDLEGVPEVASGQVVIAVYNGPAEVVVSGPEAAVARVLEQMRGRGARGAPLGVPCAFHSAQMDPALGELERAFAAVPLSLPAPGLVSDHTGALAGPDVATPAYWARHTREPVRFAGAVQALFDNGAQIVIEAGPGSLLPLITRAAAGAPLACLASVTPGPGAPRRLMESVARAWAEGAPVNWAALTPRPSRPPKLPTYPFQRKSYWLTTASPRQRTHSAPAQHTQLQAVPLDTATGVTISETVLSLRSLPFLDEHRVHGRIVVPGVVLIELMLRCAEQALDGAVGVQDLAISRPLVLSDHDERTVQVVLDPAASGRARARLYSKDPGGEWHLHVEAVMVAADPSAEPADDLEPEAFQRARGRCRTFIDHDDFYRQAWHPSFKLGPSFQLVESAYRGRSAAIGVLTPPDPKSAGMTAGVRPDLLLLDVCVQLVSVAAQPGSDSWDERPVYLGTGYQRMQIHRPVPPGSIECTALIQSSTAESLVGDLLVSDEDGRPIAEMTGVSFRPITNQILERMISAAAASTGHGGQRPRRAGARPDVMALRAASDADLQRLVLDYLVRLMASVLGSEPGEVETEVQVTTVADSLMLAELKTTIDEDLGIFLPMEALFAEGTLTALAGWVAGEVRAMGPAPQTAAAAQAPAAPAANGHAPAASTPRARSGSAAAAPIRLMNSTKLPPMSVAEMAQRARLDDSITVSGDPEPTGAGPESILLTGATGYVGAFVLEELLRRRKGEILCLVRADNQAHASHRVQANLESYGIDVGAAGSRIVPVVGDLTRPQLGLDDRAFAGLHARAGSIIHCGALVKWTYPFNGLEKANVGGTREMLRLATLGAPRPVHFVSTVGVFSSRDYLHDRVDESEDLEASGSLVVGYAQTKWVAERMVREAHGRGLPVTIHRINTGPHSASGAYNRSDHLNMLLKGCVETGTAPEDLNMRLQPAPIDYVAGAIAELSAQPSLSGRTFHLVNHHHLTWPEFYDSVEEFGYPLQRLPFEDWRENITKRQSGSVALLGLLPFLNDAVDDVKLPLSDSARTRQALGGTGLECPPMDASLVRTFLRRCISERFIDPPQKL